MREALMATKAAADIEKMSFESALSELEQIVSKLERGDVELPRGRRRGGRGRARAKVDDHVLVRARDLGRNNGWAAGAISKEVDGVIGANFRPLLKPDWRALGLDPAWAQEFKEQAEARWRLHAWPSKASRPTAHGSHKRSRQRYLTSPAGAAATYLHLPTLIGAHVCRRQSYVILAAAV